MRKQILKFGLIAGGIVAIPLYGLSVAMEGKPPPWWGALVGYTSMLIAFSTIFIAIKRRRDHDLGGVIRFWPAFGLGLGITLVASLIYILTWEAVLATTGMDFADSYVDTMIAAEQAKGVSGAALEAFTAKMEQFKADYRNPFYRMPLTAIEILPVGLLVSLICAGLLRRPEFLPLRRG
jgi:hypothetical protein